LVDPSLAGDVLADDCASARDKLAVVLLPIAETDMFFSVGDSDIQHPGFDDRTSHADRRLAAPFEQEQLSQRRVPFLTTDTVKLLRVPRQWLAG
jgi:hypothetical protein